MNSKLQPVMTDRNAAQKRWAMRSLAALCLAALALPASAQQSTGILNTVRNMFHSGSTPKPAVAPAPKPQSNPAPAMAQTAKPAIPAGAPGAPNATANANAGHLPATQTPASPANAVAAKNSSPVTPNSKPAAVPATAANAAAKPATGSAAANANSKNPVANAAAAKAPAVPNKDTKPAVTSAGKAVPAGPAMPAAKTSVSITPVSAKADVPSAIQTAMVKPVAEHSLAGRRDPFSPLIGQNTGGGGEPQNLPPGKPGLMISSLHIDGIVSGPSGMIAIVSNPQARVYFLREGDRLFDGLVQRITMEGISFHQTGKDPFGNPVEREVAKRLNSIPGEQR